MIGSVHSYMNLEAAEMTDRLLRALECPHLRVLGPSHGAHSAESRCVSLRLRRRGRGGRAAQCLSRNQRQPRASGSDGALVRAAKARGAKFVISTDAHHPKHLANMRYGVLMARRGWLERGDILNTLPLKEFAQTIST